MQLELCLPKLPNGAEGLWPKEGVATETSTAYFLPTFWREKCDRHT